MPPETSCPVASMCRIPFSPAGRGSRAANTGALASADLRGGARSAIEDLAAPIVRLPAVETKLDAGLGHTRVGFGTPAAYEVLPSAPAGLGCTARATFQDAAAAVRRRPAVVAELRAAGRHARAARVHTRVLRVVTVSVQRIVNVSVQRIVSVCVARGCIRGSAPVDALSRVCTHASFAVGSERPRFDATICGWAGYVAAAPSNDHHGDERTHLRLTTGSLDVGFQVSAEGSGGGEGR